MLTRLNTSNEISILPTGLGNHYTSGNHLVPPGRPPINLAARASIFSKSSVDDNLDNADAPEANMSFRAQNEYFGADVLVILGVILASGGAILTLVSFYCHFRHPAIQATIAGIGPSLIGIGMLFCVLRLFFCSFFTTRTCCECIADGLKYLSKQCRFMKRFHQRGPVKKKVHPLRAGNSQPPPYKTAMNGELRQATSRFPEEGRDRSQAVQNHPVTEPPRFPNSSKAIEMVSLTVTKPSPIEEESTRSETSVSIGRGKELTENLIRPSDSTDDLDTDDSLPRQDEDDILKDEIAILDQRLSSANSIKMHNQSINDLVLNRSRIVNT